MLGDRLQRAFRSVALPLRVTLWDGTQFDLAPAPTVALRFHRRYLLGMLLRGDMDGLGRAYVRGDLTAEGRLEDILDVGIALAERLGRMAWLGSVLGLLTRLPRRHSKAADAAWVRSHYDVSNDFYALWLDRRMVYSCAYFHDGDEDIDRAQEQKLDHLCRKLRLAPGERLLDVGCGWGGLLCFAARHYGVSGVGVTVSPSQHAYARRCVAEEGLSDQIDIRLQDYRDIEESEPFDKIVSVGMYEHVGHANMPLYFRKLYRLLRPGGSLLNHGITTTDPAGRAKGPPGGGFIHEFVFPGGELPHLSQVVRRMADQQLEVLDVESLRPHYTATLLRWLRQLEAHRAETIALVGEARYRIWRIYLAGCAVAFERNWLSVYQVLAAKGGADGTLRRPWTRRHQYSREGRVAVSAAPDWTGI